MTTVIICGIPHNVILTDDNFTTDLNLGEINYGNCEIRINRALPEPLKNEALCYEMVHGILMHLGYNDLTNDEHFVQALGNAIYQGFVPAVKKND
jgi:hypothetical protein